MRIFFSFLGLLLLCGSATGEPMSETYKFTIVREGAQIGTSTMSIQKNGPETIVDTATHVEVKILGFTAYRFEFSSNERWVDGRLMALTAQTDDNKTKHSLSVGSSDKKLMAEVDGKKTPLDPNTLPWSPWNAKLVNQTQALDTIDGTLKRFSVVDHGMENLTVRGQATKAHHYTVPQLDHELWYDEHDRLVKLQFKGRDGSTISYHLT
jgi:Family of unknown function (DUF6134)